MSPATATRCRSCGEECREGRSFCGRCARGRGGVTAETMRSLGPVSIDHRQAKAAAKRKLAAREVELVALLRDPIPGLRLDETLLALPHFGEQRLERTCTATNLYARRKLAALSEQERGRLVLYLRERGWLA